MRIDMTPNGVGSAVHELMRDGTSLPDAVEAVTGALRKGALLESDLIPWMVRTAEQHVYQAHRPLAFNGGAEEGQRNVETQFQNAPSGRSLLNPHALDFLFSVPGFGRKRFGDCTVPDLKKVHHRWHAWGRTLTIKAKQIKDLYEEMVAKGAKTVDDLGLDRGSLMLKGLV